MFIFICHKLQSCYEKAKTVNFHRVHLAITVHTYVVVVVDGALFVVTNFGGLMNNVSPAFSIPDHLQYFVCLQVSPVCNVVDPGTWWSSSASVAWDTACDCLLYTSPSPRD